MVPAVASVRVRTKPHIHLYPLSRLVHAQSGSWESLLKSLEEGKQNAFSYYLPAREAIVLYAKKKGSRERIVSDMISRARTIGGSRGRNVAKANLRVFESFESIFFPKIQSFVEHYLRESNFEVEFEGLLLQGAPHMKVIDSKGKTRYVFLQCSPWDEDDRKAYLELLAVIITTHLDEQPNSIWVMDLHSGSEFRWKQSIRIRNRCKSAAKLFARLAASVRNS